MFLTKELLKDKRVILASASPRRKELLSYITDDFEVVPAVGEETAPDDIAAVDVPKFLAHQKCAEVVSRVAADDDTIVIACDTVVIHKGCILGKPENSSHALEMLKELSGDTHTVSSGLCVYYRGEYHSTVSTAEVTFSRLSENELAAYIASGEPMDKAGAYGIQGLGGVMVENIRGDYYAVVGLPINSLAGMLDKML